MTESTVSERIAHHWYLRPVLFVSNLQAAIGFYIDKLGFEKRWHSADGKGTVCQVNRGGCEIILCEDAARQDKGRLFVELNRMGSMSFAARFRSARCRPRKSGGATT
jgi:catechol 2,3-dioxygenase-like lactoylglutathione lyase family enzyme